MTEEQEAEMASTLTRGVLTELEQLRTAFGEMRAENDRLRAAVDAHGRALAPAFAPQRPARPDPLDSGLGGTAAPHQVSQRSDPWGSSPEHDPRVVQAIVSGQPAQVISRLIAEITAERAASAAQRQAASSAMWRTRDGAVLRDGSAGASAPQQTSRPWGPLPGQPGT